MSMPKERYIWVASVALAALAVAAALYVDGRVTATALQQHRHYQLRALSRVSRGLRKELNDSVADLLHLSRLESFRRSRVSEARLDLEKLASVTRMRGLEGIELYDLEGKLLLQVPRQPGELLDSRRELGRADLRWASLPSNAGAVRLRVVPDGGFGPTLRVMTPVYERQETADRGGPVQAVGVVAGRVNLDTLVHRLLSDLAFTTSTQAFLVAGDHALAAFPDTLVSFDKPLPTEPRWREGAYAQEGFGWMDWVFANGVQRAAVAWLPLQVGEERWLLLAVTPGGELAGFEEHYFVLILAFGVVATVIGAGALLVRVQRSRQRLVSEVAREQQRVREAGERAWQNALLGQIVDDMRRFTDVVALLGRAARAAAEGLEASRSVIYLPDGHGLYRVEATHVRSGVSKPGPGADLLHALLGPGPLSSPLTANDLQGDSNPERREVARRLEVRSALLAPLPYGQESSGILALYECRRPRVWRDSEIRFAERLAAQVGTALEQAELYAELVRTAEVRSGLLKVAQALSVARRSLPVLELAVRVAAPLVRCRRCLILVDEESDGRWTVGAHHGLAEKGVAEAQRMRLDPSMHPYLEEVIRSRGTLCIPVV
ncbi:MAG: GAF domain-containing protein, partial [Acidobacteriota bacterium]